MVTRFAFRQIDQRDLEIFLRDGEIRSKNSRHKQQCHQTSYPEIVQLRNSDLFELPFGGVVNDYVAFYFSPVTAFTYTIHKGNVDVVSPEGVFLGPSSRDQRIFLICRVEDIYDHGLSACFSDFPLNSRAPIPSIVTRLDLLEGHVKWSVFDEAPLVAAIPEIGYNGVCRYFQSVASPPERQLRKEARMAEFLVKDAVPFNLVCAIVCGSDVVACHARRLVQVYGLNVEVMAKPDCFII